MKMESEIEDLDFSSKQILTKDDNVYDQKED